MRSGPMPSSTTSSPKLAQICPVVDLNPIFHAERSPGARRLNVTWYLRLPLPLTMRLASSKTR